ncbi:MAG: signal transduction histidine kinase, partial [Polaribacter sp.]
FSSKAVLSIKNTLKAGEIFEQINDIENFANTYINLGWQLKNRDLERAIFYMNKGIKALEKDLPKSLKLSGAYNNYGVLKHRENQLDSALIYHKKSLNICLKNKDSIGIPFALTHIAEVYLKQQQFTQAEKILKKALFIRQKRNDTYGITDSYLYLGDLYFAKNEFKTAIDYFSKAEKLAIKNSYYPLRKYATEYVYKSYEQKSDYENAFKYYKKFTKLKDSTLNKDTNSKIAELEIKFETTEKEKEIAQQKLVIKNRSLFAILLASALILLAIIFFSIYKRNQLKREQLLKEIDLKDALSIIKTQNRLQEQRLRISRDLHDNIGSQLTFIISSIDNLKYLSKNVNTKLKDKLSSISSFTSETIYQLRDTIWAMNKSEISIEDLHVRVLSFIEKAKSAAENIEFDIQQEITSKTSISSLKGMNVFRIIQEAINNAIKYADANKIVIKLSEKNQNLLVSIFDNGKGFDIKTVDLGNGLNNMGKRISEIKGSININSKKEKGTQITLSVSLKNTTNDV